MKPEIVCPIVFTVFIVLSYLAIVHNNVKLCEQRGGFVVHSYALGAACLRKQDISDDQRKVIEEIEHEAIIK